MHLQLSLPFISFFPISTPGLNFGQATAVAVVVNAVNVVAWRIWDRRAPAAGI
jgi:hypothetical protein